MGNWCLIPWGTFWGAPWNDPIRERGGWEFIYRLLSPLVECCPRQVASLTLGCACVWLICLLGLRERPAGQRRNTFDGGLALALCGNRQPELDWEQGGCVCEGIRHCLLQSGNPDVTVCSPHVSHRCPISDMVPRSMPAAHFLYFCYRPARCSCVHFTETEHWGDDLRWKCTPSHCEQVDVF